MADLGVETDPEPGTPEYCATQMDLAAQAIDAARKDIQAGGTPTGTNGSYKTYEPLWTTHGCYVGPGNDAVDRAIDSRDQACKKLSDYCADLKAMCVETSRRYKEVDHGAADVFNKQLVAGEDNS